MLQKLFIFFLYIFWSQIVFFKMFKFTIKLLTYDNFKSLEDLEQAINQGIKDESVDSGMGYESIFGCMMQISVNTNLLINDKIFTNVEQEDKIYGEDVRLSQYINSLEDYFYEWINSQYN